MTDFIPCGNCGASNARHRTRCLACGVPFYMNKHSQIRKCKNPHCWRAAYATNGLCRHHAERRVTAQRASALQANCRGCNNKLSLARTEEGCAYCVKCDERHAYAREVSPLQVATVEVEVEKLRELLKYAKDFAEPSMDAEFEYFDQLLEDK